MKMSSNKRTPSFRNSSDPELVYSRSQSEHKLKGFHHAKHHNKGTPTTSNVVHDILLKQDLSKAGILFSLNCHLILDEFPITIEILKSLIDSKSYEGNLNQQSIVEIVLTKCISALRETKMISSYYDNLLEIIEICLKYSLNSQNSDSESQPDSNRSSFGGTSGSRYEGGYPYSIVSTPHANIVSDILSCILLDYLDEELSIKAIPICIKILHHHNAKRELVREIVSYLNLIACRSPELLVDYVYYLTSGMLKGYHGLGSLLYQIAEAQIECIYPLVKHLIKGLKLIDSVNDFNYVLQIMYLVSVRHIELTLVYLEEIITYLQDTNCQEYVFDIIYSIACQTPIELEPYLELFDNRLYFDSYKVEKIIGTIGKTIKKHSGYCIELLLKRIKFLMSKYKKEVSIKKRCSLIMNERSRLLDADENENLDEFIEEKIIAEEDVEIDSLETSRNHSSFDYSVMIDSSNQKVKKRRNKIHTNNNNNTNNNIGTKVKTSNSFSYSIRNDQIRDKLNSVVTNSRILTKRFVQLLTEIYEIAQVFPYVLNPYLSEIEHLFKRHPTSCDSITYLIERLKEIQLENSPKMSSREDDLDDLSTTNEEQSSSSHDRLLKKSETDQSLTSKNSKNSNNAQASVSNRSDFVLQQQHNQEEYDEEEPELVALSKNLTIKEPRLAQPDDDSEFDMDQDFQPPPLLPTNTECECETSNLVTLTSFANNLNKQIVESDHPISSTMRIPNSNELSQEITMNVCSQTKTVDRDVVERFCTKHAEKIQNYIREVNRILPIPDLILNEVNQTDILNKSYVNSNSLCKKFKPRKTMCILKFYCQKKSPNCCLFDKNHFEITTAYPALWIHILFLAIQAKSNRVLNQQDKELIDLKLVYDKLNEKLPFVALVTSSFPQEKQISELLKELNESRIFDLFECDYSAENNQWLCYLCSNPDRVYDFSEDNRPLIQGQLKEKHGKWKFLRRWHKRMFTLTGGSIVYFKKDMRQESLNVRYIQSIQTISSSSSKEGKNVPKVFEIFTNTNSFLLKAENSSDAAQWLQFLQLSKALENTRIQNINN